MTRKPLKIGATVLVVVLALTGLMFATLRDEAQYYKRVDEVMANPAAWEGKRVQLHGYATTIMRKPNSLEYKFNVQSNGAIVPARYRGKVPDTFKEGAEVVLKGRLSADGFDVEKDGVVGKCPSKYEESKGVIPNTPGS